MLTESSKFNENKVCTPSHRCGIGYIKEAKPSPTGNSGASLSLEERISVLSEQFPTFKFWSLVLKYQRGIFLFIRANRERKMNLMISALIELVHLFFAFDHNNYAKSIEFFFRSEYMSRIPRHVSSRVYVSHSETCKQPSVDLVHISECEIHGGP